MYFLLFIIPYYFSIQYKKKKQIPIGGANMVF